MMPRIPSMAIASRFSAASRWPALSLTCSALLGIEPDAAIGYSLGETAALRRFEGLAAARRDVSPASIVATLSHRACRAMRCRPPRVGRSGRLQPVDWVAGIVPRRPKPCVR